MRRSKSAPANVYAFIDSQNLNLGTQRMGWKLDWRKFRQYLHDQFGVTQAYMFIGYLSENESMYEYMHELGYLVVLKPTVDVKQPHTEGPVGKNNKKEEEKPLIKGNVDAELVLFAMKEMPHYSKAVIVSGDGDFFSLIEYLKEQGKLANVLTPNWQYSSLLKPFEADIVRLDQLRRQLAYHDHKKKKPASEKPKG